MTTSELITKLQEIDPKGTTHVYFPGAGAFTGAYLDKSGRDGFCSFLDDKDKFVMSQNRHKVVLTSVDLESYVKLSVLNPKFKPAIEDVMRKINLEVSDHFKFYYINEIKKHYQESLDLIKASNEFEDYKRELRLEKC